MKYCPTCNKNFTDDDLGFCIDDGTVLLSGASPASQDSQATRVFEAPPTTVINSSPTDYGFGAPSPSPLPSPEPYRWANEAPVPPPAVVAPQWSPPPPPVYGLQQSQQQTVAILSLVFGLASITLGWICGGLILGLIGIVLGIVALSQAKKNPTRYGGRPLAFGGIATGSFVVVVHLILFAIYIVAMIIGAASR
jgi:hypothetical protein